MHWIETVGILVLAFAGIGIGNWISKKSYWYFGYLISLIFLMMIGVARYFSIFEMSPPFSWIMSGRSEFAIISIISTTLFVTPIARFGNKRAKFLIYILLACIVVYYSVLPFLFPGVIRQYLLGLHTTMDRNQVCLQSNGFNCGPAAAVTALRMLNLPAEEGELAVFSHTNPISGTPPDSLCLAIRRHYKDRQIVCEYRQFESIQDLRGHEPVIALVKFSFLVDHYVAVLAVSDRTVTLGDPLVGMKKLTHEDFQNLWRYRGIVLSKLDNI